MDRESATIRFITVCIAFVLIILIAGISITQYKIRQKAFENGYSQQTLPGKDGVYWVAPNENKIKNHTAE